MLQLLRVMASTPNGSWPGSPHFGLRDLLEQARTRPELLTFALDQANAALRDLGIFEYSVERLVRSSTLPPDVDHFELILTRRDTNRQPITLDLCLIS